MLIFRTLERCCGHYFCLERRLRVWLWVNVTAQSWRISMMQCQKSLMLHWHSFLGCGNERIICIFCYNTFQDIHFGRMWQFSPLIAKCASLKVVNTLLTLTLITSKQPLFTQSLYSTNYMNIIDIQYCVCMYYRLHAGGLLPLSFWLTIIHAIWVRDDVALSHSRAFRRQFMACRLFH
jgi:hypothetical protein